MDFTKEDIARIYGKRIFIIPDGETVIAGDEQAGEETRQDEPEHEGRINWRPKPTSQILFIVHEQEIKDKALGALLKKIVESLEIPFEAAGFGLYSELPEIEDFSDMPAPYGVVFDYSIHEKYGEPIKSGGREIWAAHKLSELADNREYKKVLWEKLKTLKEKL